jgi:hypothetical protein
MRKKWFVVPALALALVGIVGGAALAQVEDSNGDSPVKSLIARVAEKLGLEEATVQDAFDESRSEIRDEMIDRKLDKLIENGTLTQEEADDYGSWLDDRPDTGPAFGAFGGPGRHHRGKIFGGPGGFGDHRAFGGNGGWPAPAPTSELEGTAT